MPFIFTVLYIFFKVLSGVSFHSHPVKSVLLSPDEGGEMGEGRSPSWDSNPGFWRLSPGIIVTATTLVVPGTVLWASQV